MLSLTMKNLWAHKKRLLTSALSVVLGISFLCGSFILTDTLKGLFTDLFSSAVAGTDAMVRAEPNKEVRCQQDPYNNECRANVPASMVDTIRTADGVATAEGWVQGYAQLIDKKGKLVRAGGAPTFAFSWVTDEKLNPYKLRPGSKAPTEDNELGADAGILKKTGYKVGDEVFVNLQTGGKQRFKLVAEVTFGTSDSALGATTLFFSPKRSMENIGAPGQFQTIAVRAKDGVSEETVVANVKKVLAAEKASGGAPIEVITGTKLDEEQQKAVDTVFKFLNYFFTGFAIIALFVSIFVISNSFSIVVAQRTREMALLRTIGASRTQVLGSTVAESLAVGLLASAVGVFAGLGLASMLRALLNQFGLSLPAAGLVLKPRTVLVGMIVGTVVTLLSSIAPAYRASKVKPLAALRDVAIDRSAGSKKRFIAGIIAIVASIAALLVGLSQGGGDGAKLVGVGAGLALVGVVVIGPVLAGRLASLIGAPWFGWVISLFGVLVVIGAVAAIGVGVSKGMPAAIVPALLAGFIGVYLVRTGRAASQIPGQIARQNAMRNPARTSATALALTIGTAVVSAILVLSTSLTSTFRGAVDKTITADYIVSSTADIGFPAVVAKQVSSVPGVVASSSLRTTGMAFGFPIPKFRTLGVVDPVGFTNVVDLGEVTGDFTKLKEPDTVAIASTAMKENGWKLGDTIDPKFANQTSAVLKIVSTYSEAEGLGNLYYLTAVSTIAKYVPDSTERFVFVKTDGKDTAAFVKAADKALEPYPAAALQTKKEYADQQIGQFQLFLNLVFVLLLLSIIIAVLGIANTLKLSIFERTREVGLLRAVGTSRDQVRAMIRWEAIVVATIGAFVGLVIGTVFGAGLVKSLAKDNPIKLSIPYPILIGLTLVASIVGLYAARKPAKTAAKLNILAAIASE